MREKLEEQKAEEEGADEVEDPAKEAEQKRIEDEEEAAALAVGDTSYKRKPTKLSKKRQRREEQKKRALTGEEWSADALLCWSYEAKVICGKRRQLCCIFQFIKLVQSLPWVMEILSPTLFNFHSERKWIFQPRAPHSAAVSCVWFLSSSMLLATPLQGDMLSTLEEHFAATEQYKLSLRHLIYLRKQRAVEDTSHHVTEKGLEEGLSAERAAEKAQQAVIDS